MHDRDWQTDWKLACEAQAHSNPQSEFQRVLDICIYWLHKVRELEVENAELRRVLEAAGISVDDAGIIAKHLDEMGEDTKWAK
jgi:hypothetical protein